MDICVETRAVSEEARPAHAKTKPAVRCCIGRIIYIHGMYGIERACNLNHHLGIQCYAAPRAVTILISYCTVYSKCM